MQLLFSSSLYPGRQVQVYVVVISHTELGLQVEQTSPTLTIN